MFFDLDGTLWDATESTARAWTEVFGARDFDLKISSAQIRSVAGKPYLECLQIVAPAVAASPALAEILTELEQAERTRMHSIGGHLYPHVIEGLTDLAARSPLYLVSNCNAWYLDAFLEQSGTAGLFRACACHGSTGLPKIANLKQLMGKYGYESGYYIGDTLGDKSAAEQAGLTYLHADYGFGGEAVTTDLRFADFAAVVDFLRGQPDKPAAPRK